jgi:hypothetical protein
MALAWFRDGRPPWSGRPLGSYEAWSRIVGGILEYCGMTGFLSNLANLYEQADDEPAQWQVFFGSVFDAFQEAPFSTKALIERAAGDNAIKASLPERLGDASDRGFSRKLGLALRRRRDQVYEIGEGCVQLKEAPPDSHRQKPQWKLALSGKAPSAPFAPSYSGGSQGEKIICETSLGNTQSFFSSQQRANEVGALGANGANDTAYEMEERLAIQNEGKSCPGQD